MSAAPLTAVVLAAGRSQRMGRPKALLPLGQGTVIEEVVASLRAAGLEEIRVVTGHGHDILLPVIAKSGARVVVNTDYDRGMFSSVQAGLRDLPAACAGALILPVDIPLVRAGTIAYLARCFDADRQSLIHPLFTGRRGHPPILPIDILPAIEAWERPGGLRACLQSLARRAREVVVPDRFILRDMDTPAAYQALLAELPRRYVPDDDECDSLLRDVRPVRAAIIAHGWAVARVADTLAAALAAVGTPLALEALHAAARLHDLAKGRPEHARLGGRWLAQMGFERVAAIVAAHTDAPPAKAALGEEELLYLADKYVQGELFVTPARRFQKARAKFGADPPALAAVERRWAALARIEQAVAARLGRPVGAMLAAAGIDLSEGL